MVKHPIKAVPMPNKFDRYVIINSETGEVLDDAQGYGYRTPQKAYAAYSYHHASGAQAHRRKLNKKFVRTHKEFMDDWTQEVFYALKDGEKATYADFKALLLEDVPDYDGNIRSLYWYITHS